MLIRNSIYSQSTQAWLYSKEQGSGCQPPYSFSTVQEQSFTAWVFQEVNRSFVNISDPRAPDLLLLNSGCIINCVTAMTRKDDSDLNFKIVLVGDSGVGKSNIISKFTKNEFHIDSKTTIGVEFATKTFEVGNKTVKAQIWDTAGQERYRSMASAYYRGAHGALMVYDVTRANTFQNIQKWYKQLTSYGSEDMVCLMVGNKADLKQYRSLKYEHGQQYAKKNGMAFMETSALEGYNIDEAFQQILEEIIKRQKTKAETGGKNTSTSLPRRQTLQVQKTEEKKKCC